MRLAGKTALITGGGSGIGRATAVLFAREGARVVVADMDADGGRATASEIEAAGGKGIFHRADVSKASEARELAEVAIKTYGSIDVLFNGAGVLFYGTILDTPESDWNRVLGVNLTGTFLCCQAVLPWMIKQGRGSIINVASTTGAHDACPNAVAYVSSKGGVTLLTRAMAIDHAKQGVRVNVLCPGATDTPMLRKALTPSEVDALAATHPIGRLGNPLELAYGALFLASDEASFVTGSTLYVDGGQTAKV